MCPNMKHVCVCVSDLGLQLCPEDQGCATGAAQLYHGVLLPVAGQ